MSLKSGAFLTTANGYVVDRIQTGGVSSLNIPETKIYELGNWQTVATVRDIPDLGFDIDTYDVSCEMEAIITGQDPTALAPNQKFSFLNSQPIDVVSPFKSNVGQYDIVTGLAVPFLSLEKVDYKLSLTTPASTTYGFKGDGIYYVTGSAGNPGVPYQEVYTNTGPATYPFTHGPAQLYVENGINKYAYNVTAQSSTSSTTFKRLFLGTDYTNTATGITMITDNHLVYDKLHVTYGANNSGVTFPQTVHAPVSGSGHKPAGVFGRNIDVYIGTPSATPVFSRWTGVQSWNGTWSVKLDANKEFGNSQNVSQDFDVPNVTGTIGIRSDTAYDMWAKIAQIANVSVGQTAGAYSSVALPMEVRVTDPDFGGVIKTFYVPDARFDLPALQGKANTKVDTNFKWTSDAGILYVYNGTPSVTNYPY